MSDRPIGATYRLQLTPDRGFDAAAGLVDYLASLGVTHLYLSPILTARSGSTHGYDVVDPTTVSEALGGEPGLRRLATTAHAAGLGLIIDIVPNHLGIGPQNPLWELLLAEGQGGQGARFFDVDWSPALPGAEGKVILPVLDDQYGMVLRRGELRVVEGDEGPRLRYCDHSFPLSPESREALVRSGGVDALNGTPGQPESWARMHALLEDQHYRLVWWRIGDAVVNYRRFFAVNELAGVRVDDEAVFDHTHATILRLVGEGLIDGLRVDHPDGLRDPARYFQRLAERSAGVWTVAEKILHSAHPTHPEALPDWPVAGTTGYDFCNDVLGLFVDPAAEDLFTELEAEQFADDEDDEEHDGRDADDEQDEVEDLHDLALEYYRLLLRVAKLDVLTANLDSEFTRLTRLLWALAQQHLEARDVRQSDCVWTLAEVLASMPVYRSYVDPVSGAANDSDERVLDVSFAATGQTGPAEPEPLYELLRRLLSGRAGTSPAHLDFLARFQQLSSAVMAKGVEDTAFYRDRRLLALNEVGGDPARFGIDVADFHAANAHRARRGRVGFGVGMLTTATHDTKRGEDVRLRMAALTEVPERWRAALRPWLGWSDLQVEDSQLVLQTMIGVWPLAGSPTGQLVERVQAYAVKALREAGQGTSWVDPSHDYESEVTGFIARALGDPGFCQEMGALASAVNEIAMVSGLAQVLLRCTAPGVPDTYQGNELWDDSLVDPDNRRPVDLEARRRLLAELDAGDDVEALWASRRDGQVKLLVLSQALRARREHPAFFGPDAGYQPLEADGEWADHVVAYARTDAAGTAGAVVVVPRLPGAVMGPDLRSPLGDAWGNTTLRAPGGDCHDVLSGRIHRGGALGLRDLLVALPLALLVPGG
ncbi:MAG: malto-oligosyltrehalose synthase [Actinomycetota bacterium]|nr:malto-oligosyltrehalose synthase [Actinomycetota bacterium]